MYISIDLKSFYASVECVERGLDPLEAKLVVADESRTEKTICLAVSPALKKYGIPGRARLFEVVEQARRYGLSYVVAPPRMALYMEYSTKIYQIYLKYVAPQDIHVYSVDEVMMDVSRYLGTYQMTAKQLAQKMMLDVYQQTGITATAGIGTNLYLSKIAMDIVAKHAEADENGVRMAYLDEMEYRKQLWNHRPLTDFWRVGRGYATKLEAQGLYTMGDIARCSIGKEGEYYNEDLLYKMFGINAELLIDHAWGYEPCRMEDIKEYQPENNSISSGQVLTCPYDAKKAATVLWEMADLLVLELVEKGLETNQMVLTIGYDIENIADEKRRKAYHGAVETDRYGRKIPKHAHGSVNLTEYTSSTRKITDKVMELYHAIINDTLLIRRINLTANHIRKVKQEKEQVYEQMDLFTDYQALEAERAREEEALKKEKKMQEAMLSIKKKYGKNAILRGTNLTEGATAMERNRQIGGHKA